MSCYEQDVYDSSSEDDNADMMKRKRNIVAPKPLQLAPRRCNCSKCVWNGEYKTCEQKFVTMNDMRNYYDEQVRLQNNNAKTETMDAMAKMQANFVLLIKENEEQAKKVLLQNHQFMFLLPKESTAARERREVEKKKALLNRFKAHRRVGFKRRSVKEISPEVIAARRRARRKEVKEQKKTDELARSVEFETKTVSIEKIVAPVVEDVVDVVEVVITVTPEVITHTYSSLNVKVGEVENFSPAKKKKQMCRSVKEGVLCKHGLKCRFLHPDVKRKSRVVSATRSVVRTRMCSSVSDGKPCRHGTKCRFAHNEDELIDIECRFGKDCRNVSHQGNGVYSTVKGKGNCDRKHPGETKASICSRSGRAPVVHVVPFQKNSYLPTLQEAMGLKPVKLNFHEVIDSAWKRSTTHSR